MAILQPFGERVLVKVLEDEEKTSSGLLVKPTDKNTSNKGVVEAVGEGTILTDGSVLPLEIQVGDIVLFNSGTGTKIYEGEDIYLVLHSRDILGKLVKEDK